MSNEARGPLALQVECYRRPDGRADKLVLPHHTMAWTIVPTGQPVMLMPVKGDHPQRLATQSSVMVSVRFKSTKVKSASLPTLTSPLPVRVNNLWALRLVKATSFSRLEPALRHVIEHQRQQGLDAGHAGRGIRVGVGLFFTGVRGAWSEPTTSTTPCSSAFHKAARCRASRIGGFIWANVPILS